jgi:hypothetical protein
MILGELTQAPQPKHVNPCAGGCWFCQTVEPPTDRFTTEFDAYFHWSCLQTALFDCDRPEGEDDREAAIIGREFGIWPPKGD